MSENLQDVETYHLLKEGDADVAWQTHHHPANRGFRAFLYKHAISILSLISSISILAMLATIALHKLRNCTNVNTQIYSPVQDIIEYHTKVQEDSIHVRTAYMAKGVDGLPDIETDAAWNELYNESMHSQISFTQASKLQSKTLTVPDHPDQYLIQLEVFHQIHCVDLIRKALYVPEVPRYRSEFTDYFFGDGTTRNFGGKDAQHIDHCLDWLRQSLLCNADITPISWQSDPVAKKPLPQLPVTKSCRDMDGVWNWARENAVGGEVEFV
ncbi:MAG: hypothetical protein M1834_002147 [Cirrosporium novae-zelandiae]|nr:MAG: hypothetical protein M1834_002147 [Cirrosporium novae-zelandiae]